MPTFWATFGKYIWATFVSQHLVTLITTTTAAQQQRIIQNSFLITLHYSKLESIFFPK